MTTDLLFEQVDQQFQQYLRSVGKSATRHRATVLRVFLHTTKPLTAIELLYLVKKEKVAVSLHCVYQLLKLLVKSGLAAEILSRDGDARRYTHQLALAQCAHSHLVCKVCGTEVA